MIVGLECNNREFLKIGEIAAHIYYDGNDSVQKGERVIMQEREET